MADRTTPIAVEFTEAEATAAHASMRSVIQALVNAGAVPPRPVVNAARKLALAHAEHLGMDVPEELRSEV